MKRTNSQSTFFQPKVITTGERTLLCISLLVPANGGSKAYPPTEPQIDPKMLDDIVATVIPSANSVAGASVIPLLSRVQGLEQQIATMNATILGLANATNRPSSIKDYKSRYAIVVGNSSNEEGSLPPLQFAISDARGMEAALTARGFRVTLLEYPTTADIARAFDQIGKSITEHDLLAFYYAGSSARESDLSKENRAEQLLLVTHDFSVSKLSSALTLHQVIERMLALPNQDNLLLIDGCHGTAGLDRSELYGIANSGDILQIAPPRRMMATRWRAPEPVEVYLRSLC